MLRSEAFRGKAKAFRSKDLVSAELKERGIKVVVNRLEIVGTDHHGTHRLVWQMHAGGQFVDRSSARLPDPSWCQKAIAVTDCWEGTWIWIPAAYAKAGRMVEARRAVVRLVEINPAATTTAVVERMIWLPQHAKILSDYLKRPACGRSKPSGRSGFGTIRDS